MTTTHRSNGHRPYDVVLFGATGFTGALTAEYLATHLPADARWALAGRNATKLATVRDALPAGDAEPPALLVADSTNADSLRVVARSARVVISTVGPYLELGEPLVAACAATGTDYVDLTGEPEFVDRMYDAHHATAQQTGARLVHACGFDSIPHDLGALFTVQQLPTDAPISVRAVVRSNMSISGGTLHSALGQFSRARQMRQAAKARAAVEPATHSRRSRTRLLSGLRDRELGVWLLPLPTIDPQVVQRSAAALDAYGPDFTYSHNAGLRRATTGIAAVLGVTAFAAAAQIPPLRTFIGSRLPQGEGPSQERRNRTTFTVDFLGDGAGQSVHTQVSGGDPGYGETAKMIAQAAMCLAYDDNPAVAGQVTTAVAMGDNLIRRLVAADIAFRTLTHDQRPADS